LTDQTHTALISTQKAQLAEVIVERLYQIRPQLETTYGPRGRAKSIQDTNYHLQYLAEAITAASPPLFYEYMAWAKILLAARHVDPADLLLNLELIRDTLQAQLPAAAWAEAAPFVKGALERLPHAPVTQASFIVPQAPFFELASQYLSALLSADRPRASRLILDAVQHGTSIRDVYLHVFQPCQHEIGRLWQINQASVAQEHFCTAATQMIMSQLYPYLFAAAKHGRRLVATAVGGELHEIGVRMVADLLEMDGWDTYYLGANTPAESVRQAVADRQADVVAISATLVANIGAVAELISYLRASPQPFRAKILVGGYPFNLTEGLWRRVGADGFARSAQEVNAVAARLFEVAP
jgi:methanogenic corrinoid protein MtbC1